jgi:hypothetical protein
LITAEHALRPLREREQQIELGGPQGHQRAARREQLAAADIEAPAGKFQYPAGAAERAGTGAPQHRAHPCEQLARVEGLGQIIIGAHLEAHDAIGVLADRGQHDDRHRRGRADAAAEAQPVLARQHEVEHDEADAGAVQRLHHGSAVVRDRDPVAVLRQEFRQEGADFLVIVDDEEMRSRNHAAVSGAGSGLRSRFL